jgi:hypothetical protein
MLPKVRIPGRPDSEDASAVVIFRPALIRRNAATTTQKAKIRTLHVLFFILFLRYLGTF